MHLVPEEGEGFVEHSLGDAGVVSGGLPATPPASQVVEQRRRLQGGFWFNENPFLLKLVEPHLRQLGTCKTFKSRFCELLGFEPELMLQKKTI